MKKYRQFPYDQRRVTFAYLLGDQGDLATHLCASASEAEMLLAIFEQMANSNSAFGTDAQM